VGGQYCPISPLKRPQGLDLPAAAHYLCSCGRSRPGLVLRWCPPRQRLIAREVVLAEPGTVQCAAAERSRRYPLCRG